MTPDYQTAAIKAAETLIRHNIRTAPVLSLPMLKNTPGVLVFSFEALAHQVEKDRRCVIDTFGDRNQDAFTTVLMRDGHPQYIVTYNQLLPHVLIQRALARELGHIVLGHDGICPESVATDEVKCFAQHLLVPRPLIYAIQAAGIRLTVDVLKNLTGCSDRCIACMRRLPGVSVPADLNRAIRDQFMPYFLNFFEYQRNASFRDPSALADLGSFMDGYEE